jgi:hypothetical protein
VPKDVLKDFSGRAGEHAAKARAIWKAAAGDAPGLTVETIEPAMAKVVEAYSAATYPDRQVHALKLEPKLAFAASDFDGDASVDADEFVVVARVIAVRCFTGLTGKQVNAYFLGMEYAHAKATIGAAVPADVLAELKAKTGGFAAEAGKAFDAHKAAVGAATGLTGATLVAAMTAVAEAYAAKGAAGGTVADAVAMAAVAEKRMDADGNKCIDGDEFLSLARVVVARVYTGLLGRYVQKYFAE